MKLESIAIEKIQLDHLQQLASRTNFYGKGRGSALEQKQAEKTKETKNLSSAFDWSADSDRDRAVCLNK